MPRPLINSDPERTQGKAILLGCLFKVEGGEMVIVTGGPGDGCDWRRDGCDWRRDGGETVVTGRQMVVTGEEMYSGGPQWRDGGGWWFF